MSLPSEMEVDVNEEKVRKGNKRKNIGKCLKLTADVFRVNDGTEGGRVKGRNEVLKNRKLNCETGQPHVNCRVETLGLIMKNFDENKLKWVKELGMGGLLNLIGKSLPRGLCYWLMTRVDHLKKVFIFSPGCEYPLDRSQVRWVLGVPCGPNVVPRDACGERMSAFVEEIYEKYGVLTSKRSRYISIAKVMDVVEAKCGPEDEYEFKEAFLALALSDVLCPTTCLRLGKDLIPALSVVRDASRYDWCDLVLEKLMCNCKHFAQKFYRDGFVRGVGGCTYFLAIFYLDRLNRPPVRWGMFPRSKAWTNSDVSDAKAEDRLTSDPCSDYGKLEFVDVAYGERHPKASRDTMGPQSLAEEVARYVLVGMGVGEVKMGEEESVVEIRRRRRKGRAERRKGPADGSNPYLRKLAKRAREKNCQSKGNQQSNSVVVQEVDGPLQDACAGQRVEHGFVDEENEMVHVKSTVECAIRFGVEGGHVTGPNVCGSNYMWGMVDGSPNGVGRGECCSSTILGEVGDVCLGSGVNGEGDEVVQDSDVLEVELGCVEEGKMCRSRPRRPMKPSGTVLDKEFDVDVVPRHNSKLKAKLLKYVCTAGAILKDEAGLEVSEKTQEDVVMLKVGEMYASLINCYSVAAADHGGVDDNYVRVAAVLYRVVWKKKFMDGGTRYMVDPTFAVRVFQEVGPPSGWNDCRRLAKSYVKHFSKKTADRLHVVFVPILEDDHWWCAAFSVNTNELWVIDSASSNPVDAHDSALWKLCAAMDIFLCALDITWIPGRVQSWARKAVMMDPQMDGDSCGVRMLLAIKACASRYTTEYRLPRDIVEERGWLLNDDIMDDANEVKEQVKQLLVEYDA